MATSALIGEFGLKEILRVLRRRLKIIIAMAVVATSAAAVISNAITPRYTASAQVVLDPRAFRVANMESVLGDLPGDAATLETQVGIIESRGYAERVVDQLRLPDRPAFKPGPSALRRQLASWLEGPLGIVSWLPEQLVSAGLAEPLAMFATDQRSAEAQRQQVIQEVLDHVRAKQDGRLISIAITSTDPQASAEIADAFARLYIDDQRQAKIAATSHAQSWLGERVKELRGELQRTESAIEAFRATHNLLDLGGTSSAVQQVNDFSRQLMALQTERAEREAHLRRLRELRSREQAVPELAAMLSSPTINALRQQDIALIGQLAQLGQEFGDKHPTMLRLQAERVDIQRRIGTEVDSILRTLESDLTVLRARENTLQGRLDQASGTMAETKQAEVQLRELEREAEANRALYTNFLARYKETSEQQDLIQPDTQLVASASVPLEPSWPKPKLITAAGFAGSLLIGTLIALLAEHMDGRLRSAGQAERALGIRNLGLVPRFRRGLRRRPKLQQYLFDQPLSAYAEALRGIDATVRQSWGTEANVIQVTSSLPGEGKTTFALSLATMAALAGRRTIVVDLDLRRPSVHRQLDRPLAFGLAEYLVGSCSLDEVRQVDSVLSHLHFLPVKLLPTNPSNLLASPELTELLATLRKSYDCIVLDTPPLLGLTDARMVAKHADQVVLVVRWEKTTGEIALNGVRSLQEVKAPLVGSVLTQVNVKRHARFRYGDAEQYYSSYVKYYAS